MAGGDAELIQRLYNGLDRHDGEAMAGCYRPEAHFEDPVFGELDGRRAGDMWRMLTSRAEDLTVELADHEAAGGEGSAHWIARYTFGATGRSVVNDVRASFRFADGLIIDHVDRFSFYRWSRQALGPIGVALGWTPFLRAGTRRRALADLERFSAERGGAG
jgi:hypothetical protein